MNSNQNRNAGFLLADITRRVRAVFQRRLEGTDLTLAQAKALLYVSRQQGVKQKELADALDIQPMTMAKQLDQLAQRGLIERLPDVTDRRAHLIHLTPAAQPVLAEVEAVSAALRAEIMQDLSEAEAEQFVHTLNLIQQRLTGM